MSGVWTAAADDDGRLYLAGGDARERQWVAFLDAGRWVKLPSLGRRVTALSAVSENDIWAIAGGWEYGFGGEYVYHWDGKTWSKTDFIGERGAGLMGITALAPDNVWAVGVQLQLGKSYDGEQGYEPVALHWNGKRWQRQRLPGVTAVLSGLQGVAVAADEVWAVGWIDSAQNAAAGLPASGTQFAPLAFRFDGRGWERVKAKNVGDGGTRFVAVAAGADGRPWILALTVDSGESGADASRPALWRPRDDAWQMVAPPSLVSPAPGRALTVDKKGAVWVGCGGGEAPCAYRWDGAAWAAWGPDDLGFEHASTETSHGNAAIVALPDAVWFVGGVSQKPGGATVWRFDGSMWSRAQTLPK